jgi:hypothetical protein
MVVRESQIHFTIVRCSGTLLSMADDEQAKRYAYKPSVAGSPQVFVLTAEGLSFQGGFRSGIWRYGDIARIRLSYRPVSMLAHRFRADVRHKDGRRLTIVSATWAGIVALTPQNDSYRAFIEDLHRRIAAASRDVECLAGLPRPSFAFAAAAFAAVIIALAGLSLRALMSEQYIAALFILGFGAWFGWHTGRMLMRNKPRRYEVDNVPRQLLP